MTTPSTPASDNSFTREAARRWVWAILVIFFFTGLTFGSWLSRLPAVRDALGASTVQMSYYGLCLAFGSVFGLVFSGRLVDRFAPRKIMAVTIPGMAIALPIAAALMFAGMLPIGLVLLFGFGFCYSTTDVAMNVSGAVAERVLGKPRLPLMHACYSIGSVVSLGVGAFAERIGVAVPWHFALVGACTLLGGVAVLWLVPRDESGARVEAEAVALAEPGGDAAHTGDAGARSARSSTLETTGPVPIITASANTMQGPPATTGAIPTVSAAAHADAATDPAANATTGPAAPVKPARYNPWRDPRVLLIGFITVTAGLVEGAPSDWLPLALVDGRGVGNEFGALMLGVFYTAVVAARLAGSAILARFDRVAVLRVSISVATLGILITALVAHPFGVVVGTILWGLGTGIVWPTTISAAADRVETANRDVAAVTAIGYASMLVGPMAFGFLGEHFGLLQAFLLLPLFTIAAIFLAGVTRRSA